MFLKSERSLANNGACDDRISFIESKHLDKEGVFDLLKACQQANQWANRGPLYWRLASAYSEHMAVPEDCRITPCANAGLALEGLARLHADLRGRKLRWIACAFSFQNLGRGYFADAEIVDCDADGLLDLDGLRAKDPDSYDGIVLVNPMGLFADLKTFTDFAAERGKALIIDNAAGIHTGIPNWPWQVFSLHHTKPYGFGEGGLALTPAHHAEDLYAFIDYGASPVDPALWLNNGKLSDVACAFHIARLERYSEWAPNYFEQRRRIVRIAEQFGLRPLALQSNSPPTMSMPFLAPSPIAVEKTKHTRHMTLAKYYKPIQPRPQAVAVFERLINISTHPDMARLSDAQIAEDIQVCIG